MGLMEFSFEGVRTIPIENSFKRFRTKTREEKKTGSPSVGLQPRHKQNLPHINRRKHQLQDLSNKQEH